MEIQQNMNESIQELLTEIYAIIDVFRIAENTDKEVFLSKIIERLDAIKEIAE